MPTSDIGLDAMTAITEYVLASGADRTITQMHLAGTGAVAELEAKLRLHYGMKYALCVSNASTGLLALALALDLKNEEFITTPMTYGATVSGWMLMGNRLVFADIDPLTLTLDPKSTAKAISSKTKAILGVDILGNPSDSKALRRIADEHGLWYIADCSQSLGAFRDGRPASSDADALVVSFTTGKAVFAGEGGAILTNNTDLYNKLLWFTQHPLRQRRELGLVLDNEFGLNGRIHPLSAIWANAVFDESLRCIAKLRSEWFKLAVAFDEIGLTEKLDYTAGAIEPSFFRFTAAWREGARPGELHAALLKQGYDTETEPIPLRLIYKQASFAAASPRSSRKKSGASPKAEDQAIRRFCITRVNRDQGGRL